jgi:hypothetical protein
MFKTGDKIVCVDNKNFTQVLTVGKVYNVSIGQQSYGNNHQVIITQNDIGRTVVSFNAYRFKLYEEILFPEELFTL